MIRPLRQRHRLMVCTLGVVLPVAFAVGLAARKPVPLATTVPPELAGRTNDLGGVVWTKPDLWTGQSITTRLRRDAAGNVTVELISPAILRRPWDRLRMMESAVGADARRERGKMPAAASDQVSNEADAPAPPPRLEVFPTVSSVLKPDVLVYWAAGKEAAIDGLPANAQLLGPLSNDTPLPVSVAARGEAGRFVLYSLAEHEVVGVSKSSILDSD